MTQERPYLQIPAPTEEDRRRFEEWIKEKEKAEERDDNDNRGVIVIEI